jgi:hypothetical protein
LADVVVAYLKQVVDPNVLNAAPVVAFYDPMSIVDSADRIIVSIPNGNTMAEMLANGVAQVDVDVKTQISQAAMPADIGKHRDRTNEVRDKLFSGTLLADLLTQCAGKGINVEYVQPARRFGTQLFDEDGGGGYARSELGLQIHFFAVDN